MGMAAVECGCFPLHLHSSAPAGASQGCDVDPCVPHGHSPSPAALSPTPKAPHGHPCCKEPPTPEPRAGVAPFQLCPRQRQEQGGASPGAWTCLLLRASQPGLQLGFWLLPPLRTAPTGGNVSTRRHESAPVQGTHLGWSNGSIWEWGKGGTCRRSSSRGCAWSLPTSRRRRSSPQSTCSVARKGSQWEILAAHSWHSPPELIPSGQTLQF